MPSVRDRLLHILFNLFGPQFSRVMGRTDTASPPYSPSTSSSNDRAVLSDCNQHRALILHACHLIASYLGEFAFSTHNHVLCLSAVDYRCALFVVNDA